MLGRQIKQKKKSNLTLTQNNFNQRKKMSVKKMEHDLTDKSMLRDTFSPPDSPKDIHSEIHSKEIETLEDDPLLVQQHQSIATY